jgi:hypothetical protein
MTEAEEMMSEKKCEDKSVNQPKRHDIICNLYSTKPEHNTNEIIAISMSDRLIEDHIIKNFKEKDNPQRKENRWTIDFQYGSNHFVVYFSEDAAKDFRQKVNESFEGYEEVNYEEGQ